MPVDYFEAIARLLLALVLGVLIGLERQVRGSPAGMRTFGLVSIGACLYMLVGLLSGVTSSGGPGDQGRIAAQVVTGVGFLGGGMLIHTGASVHGLTTSAGIWVAAAVGLAAGEGLYYLAIAAALLVLVVLRVLRWAERRFHLSPQQVQDELHPPAG
ncbi:MAG: MgtC/SapB family protein [Chloroflexota bacterium]